MTVCSKTQREYKVGDFLVRSRLLLLKVKKDAFSTKIDFVFLSLVSGRVIKNLWRF